MLTNIWYILNEILPGPGEKRNPNIIIFVTKDVYKPQSTLTYFKNITIPGRKECRGEKWGKSRE